MPRIKPVSLSRYRSALGRRIAGQSQVQPGSGAAPAVCTHDMNPVLENDLLPRESVFTAENLVDALAPGLNFWWFADKKSNVLRLGSTGDAATLLLDAVLRTATESGFEIEIRDKRSNGLLANSVRKTHALLDQNEMVRLVLFDKRSDCPPMAVLVERWRETPEGHISTPSNNHIASRLWKSTLDSTEEVSGARALLDYLPAEPAEYPDFEIDWVFSWVNGDDPDWQKLFSEWKPGVQSDATDRSRFATRDDLRFALRSLDQFAPWIRKIFVFTNCKPPAWLDEASERIVWVDHSEVIDAEYLPTFSSHAIETWIHRIEGLSEHFVYSNDDFFLTRMTTKSDFFYANGIARLRLEKHGMVNGPVTEGDPDYLNGARNAAELLRAEFGKYPVRLHTHSPQSMNRAVLREMEERFLAEFQRTRANRFRHYSDVAVTGFLYHHYAFLTSRAVPDGGQTLLIQQNHAYEQMFAKLLDSFESGRHSQYLSTCVNDGRGSVDNSDWDEQARTFLSRYFPVPSQFEKAGAKHE